MGRKKTRENVREQTASAHHQSIYACTSHPLSCSSRTSESLPITFGNSWLPRQPASSTYVLEVENNVSVRMREREREREREKERERERAHTPTHRQYLQPNQGLLQGRGTYTHTGSMHMSAMEKRVCGRVSERVSRSVEMYLLVGS